MKNSIKKLLLAGALASGLFMTLTACDVSSFFAPSSSSSEVVLVPESISATNNKQSYEHGEDLDITVIATYSDETTQEIKNYEVAGFNNQVSGEQTITITYLGKTCTITVTVVDPTLVDISVSGNKETYEWGEDLDITVLAHYSNNSYETVTDYEVAGFDSQTPGEQTVTITYEGETYTFTIVVNNPALVGITAVSNKDSYEWGEDLSISVYANYADGSSVLIDQYTVDGFNSHNPGSQDVTITYGEFNYSLKVTVNERKNRFPIDNLNTFVSNEGIETSVPAPVGYEAWNIDTDIDTDGKRYFLATTSDEGTAGVDTIADEYSAALRSANWTVTSSDNVYEASKEPNDVKVIFSTKDQEFTLRVDSYSEFPNKGLAGVLVKTSSDLKDGDKIVLGNISLSSAVSGLSNGTFVTKECQYQSNELVNPTKDICRITLNRTVSYWTLSCNGKKLGASSDGKLVWDEGSMEWTITMSNNFAILMNKTRDFGQLCYNKNTGTLAMHKNTSGSTYVYPQLFKLTEKDLIYPTAIKISGRSNVALNKEGTLSLTYTPSNANVFYDVNWTSSNTNVATVSKGVVTPVSAGQTTITATTKTKGKSLTSTFDVTVSAVVPNRWTVMIYMCGADLESDSGLASSDIAEILSVNNQPEDMNIILETGGARRWRSYGIDANALSRYHVENKSLVLDTKLSKDNMGKQSTLESFLKWGLEEYPADRVGVIFWNHGGALDGCCYDENYSNDSLLNSEVSAAFKNVFTQKNITDKLEFVGYDACLMQVQDIAEVNSHYFNYMIGSEEAESGYGWDYDKWVDDLYADKDTPVILKEVCDSFLTSVGTTSDQTLSYLDLSKINDYYTKFEAMAAAIKSTAKSSSNTFKSILKSTKSFGDTYYDYYGTVSGLQLFGTIDGYDFLNRLGNSSVFSNYKSKINEAKEAYKELVAYSRAGSAAGNANGLIVIAGTYISYPSSETAFNNWRSLF